LLGSYVYEVVLEEGKVVEDVQDVLLDIHGEYPMLVQHEFQTQVWLQFQPAIAV
jgi:hypothetical protein